MFYLALNVVFGSAFMLILKWVQSHSRADILTIGAINYIAACAWITPEVLGKWWTLADIPISGFEMLSAWLWGGVLGTCYFLAFFFVTRAVRHVGASRTSVVGALSILVPIVCGVWIWSERPSSWQWLGVALAILSLILISGRGQEAHFRWSWSTVGTLVAFFLLAGVARLAQQGFRFSSHVELRSVFLWATFACASIPSFLMLMWRGRPRKREWVIGVGLGTVNILQTYFMLVSLRYFQGYVVFPVSSAGGVVLTALVAILLLGENVHRRALGGIVLAAASLVLLNWPTPD